MAPSLPTGALDSNEPKSHDKEEKSELPKKIIVDGNLELGLGTQTDQVGLIKYLLVASCDK